MTRYAEGTDVPIKQSRSEVEHLLDRYGAEDYAFGKEGGNPVIMFRYHGRQVRLKLTLPTLEEFESTPSGRYIRTASEKRKAQAREEMRLWRGLVLILKAKLEAVASGIGTMEHEFMADIVLTEQGETIGDRVLPQLGAGRTVTIIRE